MSTGLPPSLRHRLSYLLGRLYLRGLDLELQALEPLGIDVKHHAVLTVLADQGPMTQQQLGHQLGIDRTTIVAVIDGLDRTGLVERRRDPADRRAYQVTVTPSGHDTHQRGLRLLDGTGTALLSALNATERRTLIELLARAAERG